MYARVQRALIHMTLIHKCQSRLTGFGVALEVCSHENCPSNVPLLLVGHSLFFFPFLFTTSSM